MMSPTPRTLNRNTASVADDGTWIEPEEFAYNSPSFTRRAYVIIRPNPNNPGAVPEAVYGTKRVVRLGIPDTYFTIPARLQVGTRRIKGYVSVDGETGFTFTPEAK